MENELRGGKVNSLTCWVLIWIIQGLIDFIGIFLWHMTSNPWTIVMAIVIAVAFGMFLSTKIGDDEI